MRVKLTLKKKALREAKEMRRVRNINTPWDFEGPEFQNVKWAGFDSKEWYRVHLEDGTEYLYPAKNLARVAKYK